MEKPQWILWLIIPRVIVLAGELRFIHSTSSLVPFVFSTFLHRSQTKKKKKSSLYLSLTIQILRSEWERSIECVKWIIAQEAGAAKKRGKKRKKTEWMSKAGHGADQMEISESGKFKRLPCLGHMHSIQAVPWLAAAGSILVNHHI